MGANTTDPCASVTLESHLIALRAADKEFHDERDRRYAEVALEREKALKIKEEADKIALQLAREIQVYKDEKANELRSQIERERGSYATHPELISAIDKVEAVIKPLLAFVTSQQGRSKGLDQWYGWLIMAAMLAVAIYFR